MFTRPSYLTAERFTRSPRDSKVNVIVILCSVDFWKIVGLYEQLHVDYNLCYVVIEACSESVY